VAVALVQMLSAMPWRRKNERTRSSLPKRLFLFSHQFIFSRLGFGLALAWLGFGFVLFFLLPLFGVGVHLPFAPSPLSI
jgi:hypothetical protein